MPTSAVYEAAVRYRQALIARERLAATALVRSYGEAWSRLQADIVALTAEIDARRARGETITRGELVRLTRMREIQRQTAEELERYVGFADQSLQDGKRWAVAAAEQQAHELVQLSFPSASVRATFYRMPRDAAEALIGTTRDGSPLRAVLEKYAGDAAEQLAETMITGMVAGWNPRKLASEMRKVFGMGLTDSLRLSRTEQIRAYRTATLETYRANDGIVRGWRRFATRDARTCLACIMEDGREYTLAEEMDDHSQGRCSLIPLTAAYEELGIDAPEPTYNPGTAREWFESQPESVQRSMMNHISVEAYDAWKSGLFALEDIPQHNHNDEWGGSWTEKPMYRLLGLDAPQLTYKDTVLDMMGENLERAFREAGL